MCAEFSHRPQLFDGMSFFPRVSRYHGRAIEEAMAGRNLFDRAVRSHGTVVEAAFAASDPPPLARLREGQVARLIDPQSLRFATETLLEIPLLNDFSYAPDRTAGALAPAV